jgi:hypothetical protein
LPKRRSGNTAGGDRDTAAKGIQFDIANESLRHPLTAGAANRRGRAAMAPRAGKPTYSVGCAVLGLALACTASVGSARAGEVTEEQIIKALTPATGGWIAPQSMRR